MAKIDVNAVIDGAPLRGLPLWVVVLSTLVLVLDGLDIQIISLVAPLLSRDFHVPSPALGPVVAAALLGMALGGFAFGVLGDRWGRRPTLSYSVALFAAATLLGATAQSIGALTAWRFLTGIGLGGAIPNAMALLAEYTGPRWRTHAIGAAVIGVPIGGTAGAAIAACVLPHSGWRPMFLIGGVLPAIALAAIWAWLPESPCYLVLRPGKHRALAELLNRIVRQQRYTDADEFYLADRVAKTSRSGIGTLLQGPLGRDTVGLWLIFLTNMFMIYTFFGWTPIILSSLSLSLAVAVRGSLIFNLAGVCGGLTAAWWIYRFGSRRPGLLFSLLGIGALLLIAQLLTGAVQTGTPPDVTELLVEIAAVGFAMIGIQTVAYRLSTHVYPTAIRASGVGWAAGAGRMGGIMSSLTAGWLYARLHGPGLFFILACVVTGTLLFLFAVRSHIAPVGGPEVPTLPIRPGK